MTRPHEFIIIFYLSNVKGCLFLHYFCCLSSGVFTLANCRHVISLYIIMFDLFIGFALLNSPSWVLFHSRSLKNLFFWNRK
jgi:hypothetical protein